MTAGGRSFYKHRMTAGGGLEMTILPLVLFIPKTPKDLAVFDMHMPTTYDHERPRLFVETRFIAS